MSDYKVLARKWRPKVFEDVVGQSHVTRSLQNAIKTQKVGHSFLLVGTRGIGKTTVARLLAKTLRCEDVLESTNPCGECSSCQSFDSANSLDVLEIDGASNNSVENIREIVSNINYLPATGRYKIYIIDEVHMLSISAFNALLKTLEEPPEHAIFIFATTEPQKIPGTILSRCQRFDFKRAQTSDLSSLLNRISKVEEINFENEEVVSQICELGKGSFRDTLSLLEQALVYSYDKNITEEVIQESLGVARISSIRDIIKNIFLGKTDSVMNIYHDLLDNNVASKSIFISLQGTIYKVVQNPKLISSLLGEEASNFSMSEVLWVSETIYRDSSWIFETPTPDQAFGLCLSKVSSRREILESRQSGIEISEKKDIDSSIPPAKTQKKNEKLENVLDPKEKPQLENNKSLKEEVIRPAEETKNLEVPQTKSKEILADHIASEKDFTWRGFLKYLSQHSPASSSNLEQGNILEPLSYDKNSLRLNLGFPAVSKVFYEYVSEPDVYKKLINHLGDYFELSNDKIKFEINLIEQEKDFKSIADLEIEKREEKRKNKIDEIKSNPLIKKAEEVFNTKIDKVILKE